MNTFSGEQPPKKIECPYCALIEDAKIHKEKIVYEGEKVVLITSKSHSGTDLSAIIISKQHFEGLSYAGEEEVLETFELAKKYIKSFAVEHPNVDGFRCNSAEGEGSGQTIHHFHFNIFPVFGGKEDQKESSEELSKGNKFFDPKPGDEHVIKPSKPAPMYDCPYCDIIMNLQSRTDIVDQNEKAFIMKNPDPAPEGQESVLVITKKHFMNLSFVDDSDLFDSVTLTRKYIDSVKKHRSGLRGFIYFYLQGSKSGQKVFHFSLRVNSIF